MGSRSMIVSPIHAFVTRLSMGFTTSVSALFPPHPFVSRPGVRRACCLPGRLLGAIGSRRPPCGDEPCGAPAQIEAGRAAAEAGERKRGWWKRDDVLKVTGMGWVYGGASDLSDDWGMGACGYGCGEGSVSIPCHDSVLLLCTWPKNKFCPSQPAFAIS